MLLGTRNGLAASEGPFSIFPLFILGLRVPAACLHSACVCSFLGLEQGFIGACAGLLARSAAIGSFFCRWRLKSPAVAAQQLSSLSLDKVEGGIFCGAC
jgi:hypothetical protein